MAKKEKTINALATEEGVLRNDGLATVLTSLQENFNPESTTQADSIALHWNDRHIYWIPDKETGMRIKYRGGSYLSTIEQNDKKRMLEQFADENAAMEKLAEENGRQYIFRQPRREPAKVYQMSEDEDI